MLRKIGYVLIIASYLFFAFLIIYTNVINPQCDKTLLVILFVSAVVILSSGLMILSKLKDDKNEDKLSRVLKTIAGLPMYLIVVPVVFLAVIVMLFIGMVANRFRKKVRGLLKNGYTCRKEKEQKRKIYYLSKENIVIKISEYDIYEISTDGGNSFERVENSSVFSAYQREEFGWNLSEFNDCNDRDSDSYDPTSKLVEMILMRDGKEIL